MEDYRPQLKEAFRATSIIGYATSLSVIIYGLIANFLLSRYSGVGPGSAQRELFVVIFCGLGAGLLVGIGPLRPAIRKICRPQEYGVASVIRELQSSTMVTYGICETISILGLVLAILSKDIQNYYWMAFMSLVAFGAYFPKYENWERHIRNSLEYSDIGEGGGA